MYQLQQYTTEIIIHVRQVKTEADNIKQISSPSRNRLLVAEDDSED